MNFRLAMVVLVSGLTIVPVHAAGINDCTKQQDIGALQACDRLVENNAGLSKRDLAQVLSQRAYLNRKLRSFPADKLLADLDRAVQLGPTADILNARGNARFANGDLEGALADYDKVLSLDPKKYSAWNSRGSVYFEKGQVDLALRDYAQSLSITPDWNYQPYFRRAEVLLAKRDFAGASSQLDAVRAQLGPRVEYSDEGSRLFEHRGMVSAAQGQWDEAILAYNDAERWNVFEPLRASVYVRRGLAYEALGKTEPAKANFRAALANLPWEFEQRKYLDIARQHLAALLTGPAVAEKPAKAEQQAAIPAKPPAVTRPNDRRIALVIGNSLYQSAPKLENPSNDAQLIADKLRLVGFDKVTLQLNLGKDSLTRALRDFAENAENADWALVYYAGHGIEIGGMNYLVPVDARLATDRDVSFEAVPLDQVLNSAERARKLRLIVLDACRDNPFASQMRRSLTMASRSVTRGLAAVEPDAGTLVVFAAKDGETALDGAGRNSPFATAFDKNVGTPGLEVRRLFDFVRDDVLEATDRKQKPFSYGSISGRQDFYFVAAQ